MDKTGSESPGIPVEDGVIRAALDGTVDESHQDLDMSTNDEINNYQLIL